MMPDVSFGNLLAISAIALLAPLLLGFAPKIPIPAVVVEIVAGIVVGPSVLGWVKIDLPVQILAVVGLAFLLLLAGLEIDLAKLRGRPLGLALAGFAITLALGLGVGAVTGAAGWVSSPLLLAITLSATSLGLVVPVLKDAMQLRGPVGQVIIAAASVADFGAIVLLSVLFSTSGGSAGSKVVLFCVFGVLVAVTALVVLGSANWTRLGEVLFRLQDSTAEIRIRATIVLLMAFVALASRFGLETILGAFLAGAVIGLVDRDTTSHPSYRLKLEAIGYGFLVPVFFVSSGIHLDLRGLFADPATLARVPVFLLALLIVRGVPALLHLRLLGVRSTAAAALLQATSLPFIVTATRIGESLGLIDAVTSAALVTAGLLSVLVFPALALSLLRPSTTGKPVAAKGAQHPA